MNTPIDTIRQAYLLGWIKAARWANRDDLIDDIDSPAYTKDADAALAELERTQHTDLERKDALLKQAREVLWETRVNPEDYDFGPAYEGAKRHRHEVLKTITKELAK